ncbi:MAG: HAMP domain-containing sensor histidine kinase [Eggerthellaceae bacterium]|nr:HAMP domain-containing sensor histidine kinase [Eggerthellaceae bacterium]
MIAVACLIAFAAGAGVVALLHGCELRRLARALRTRDRGSNQRLTVEIPGRGIAELVRAVNDEFDAMQAERAAAAQRHGEFQRDLANLSHDIRTPLTGAKGFLQLAQGELGKDAPRNSAAEDTEAVRATEAAETAPIDRSTLKRYLASADARLDDMSALLNQLFAYTRANDPDAELALTRVAVLPVLADVLVGHYPAFEQRGWEPACTFADEALAVEANEDALARIFDNLVSNALRHGTTALEVTQVDDAIAFTNGVSDKTAATLDADQLFDRFYRADAARTTGGSGLGLAVAAKMAESMGMRLSAALDGNRFTITLHLGA